VARAQSVNRQLGWFAQISIKGKIHGLDMAFRLSRRSLKIGSVLCWTIHVSSAV
jgi:hypothetical protein